VERGRAWRGKEESKEKRDGGGEKERKEGLDRRREQYRCGCRINDFFPLQVLQVEEEKVVVPARLPEGLGSEARSGGRE